MTKIAKVWLARHYPHWAADTAMRYLPVARFLGRHLRGGERVLEVGGGDYGLSPYWPGAFVLTDLRLFRKPEGLPKVEASTLGLPFPDGSFDWVVSIDMLEHVPPALRGSRDPGALSGRAAARRARVSRRRGGGASRPRPP